MWRAILLLLGLMKVRSRKCRGIAIEGGGSHGAYEAGCIAETVSLLPSDDVKWDIVSGISTGALNSGGMSQFAMGDEKEMAEFIQFVWLNINGSSHVYKEWTGGVIQGLLFESGLYDTEPLKETLEHFFTKGIHRKVSVGSANLNTGMFATFNETLGGEKLLEGIMCSAAPPPFFPPQNFLNNWWIDGGTITSIDISTAIVRCLDDVKKQEDVIIDMVFDEYKYLSDSETDYHTLEVLWRASKIRKYDSKMWYVYKTQAAYPDVDFRYLFEPTQKLPGGLLPLDFKEKDLQDEINLGKSDAKKVINSRAHTRDVIDKKLREIKENVFYIDEFN